MYWEKRNKKNGHVIYSFAYYDKALNKPIRLKKCAVPSDIQTDEAAAKFCKLREAEHESVKMRIVRKLEWKNKYYDFNELLEIFTQEMKKMAPNSWENNIYYLEQYVLPFFLNEKQCNNLNNWCLFYDEFKSWLETVKPSKGMKGTIAYSTQNHIISALNSFMVVMKSKRKVEKTDKCQKHSSHLLNVRDVNDVFSTEEVSVIMGILNEEDDHLAGLFTVLLNTGLRISEALALSISDLFEGEPEAEILKDSLAKHKLSTLGYLSVDSQVRDSINVRDKTGVVHRKPLKGRKKIKSGEGRVVPILDRDTFNLLAKRFNEQLKLYEEKKYGPDEKNYLLFNGISRNNLNKALSIFYTSPLGKKYKSKCQHCARHTFSTNFVGLVQGDFFLAKMVLGHKDMDTTMRYVHIFEAINRKIKTKGLKKSGMNLVM